MAIRWELQLLCEVCKSLTLIEDEEHIMSATGIRYHIRCPNCGFINSEVILTPDVAEYTMYQGPEEDLR